MEPAKPQVTALLQQWSRGDRDALEKLTPLVYEELRGIAAGYMRRENPGHTLQTSALVNEAYLRLIDQQQVALAEPRPLFRHRGAVDAAHPD